VLLVAIVILTAFRPGDAPWINDEPILMEMAIRYNHTASDIYGFDLPFTPCPYGLEGTRGARYGPLPVWVDQIFLGFTSNIVAMVACRAMLFSGLTALGVASLARTLRLSPWFAVVTMCSPWLWIFSRSLWDSTWCIPLCAILFASYAAFLAKPAASSMCLTLLSGILLPLVHLTAVAMVLPVAVHLLIVHHRSVWRWKWRLGAIVLVCLYLFHPYLIFFVSHTRPKVPDEQPELPGWFFPLLGGHYLTLGLGGATLCDGWQDAAPKLLLSLAFIARWISWMAIPMVWLGTGLAIRHIRDRGVKENLGLIAVGVCICQTCLDGVMRVYLNLNYYAATWIVYAFFAWIAVDWLLSRSKQAVLIVKQLIAIYTASILSGIGIIAVVVARNGGTRGIHYGTSVANQVYAVRTVQQFSDLSSVDIEIPQWQLYPRAYQVLLELSPPPTGPRPERRLIVKYRDAFPGDARIEVVAKSP